MLDEKALERALDARPYGLLSVRTMIEPNHDAAELLTAAITAYLAALPSGALGYMRQEDVEDRRTTEAIERAVVIAEMHDHQGVIAAAIRALSPVKGDGQ